MKKIFEELNKNENQRTNLSNLRKLIKDDSEKAKCLSLVKDNEAVIVGFLDNEDAKTRKNAALLLGDLAYQGAIDDLWKAYKKETTLFVKASYLNAISSLDAGDIYDDLRDELAKLSQVEVTDENRKHIDEQLRELRKIQLQYEGVKKHTFAFGSNERTVLLTCNRLHREIVRRMIKNGQAEVHPLGVLVKTDDFDEIRKLRTYRDMLFPVMTDKLLSANPIKAAEEVVAGGLVELVKSLHKEKHNFYFRVEVKSPMDLEMRSDFTKKFSTAVERESKGSLINSTSDYEIEVRLIANRDGMYFACVKCNTIKDNRFNYRRNVVASSIHPSTAALIMEIASPYLKDRGQILDPFCGVGTMLVERTYRVNAREMYGIDIFKDAVDGARENADTAGMHINYIHRDFFDFKHDYLFDEIVTNMPVRGKKTKEEMEVIYKRFFDKAGELMVPDAKIIMYTNEIGFVKKQLRLHKEYQLLQESLMIKKSGYYLLIINVRG